MRYYPRENRNSLAREQDRAFQEALLLHWIPFVKSWRIASILASMRESLLRTDEKEVGIDVADYFEDYRVRNVSGRKTRLEAFEVPEKSVGALCVFAGQTVGPTRILAVRFDLEHDHEILRYEEPGRKSVEYGPGPDNSTPKDIGIREFSYLAAARSLASQLPSTLATSAENAPAIPHDSARAARSLFGSAIAN